MWYDGLAVNTERLLLASGRSRHPGACIANYLKATELENPGEKDFRGPGNG